MLRCCRRLTIAVRWCRRGLRFLRVTLICGLVRLSIGRSRTGWRRAVVYLTGEGSAYALQRLAREQMKHKLQTDILTDLSVCRIEGWPLLEYVHDLHRLIAHYDPCGVRDG